MQLKEFYTALVKVGFLSFEMCFKVTDMLTWAVNCKNYNIVFGLQREHIKNNNWITMPHDVC